MYFRAIKLQDNQAIITFQRDEINFTPAQRFDIEVSALFDFFKVYIPVAETLISLTLHHQNMSDFHYLLSITNPSFTTRKLRSIKYVGYPSFDPSMQLMEVYFDTEDLISVLKEYRKSLKFQLAIEKTQATFWKEF